MGWAKTAAEHADRVENGQKRKGGRRKGWERGIGRWSNCYKIGVWSRLKSGYGYSAFGFNVAILRSAFDSERRTRIECEWTIRAYPYSFHVSRRNLIIGTTMLIKTVGLLVVSFWRDWISHALLYFLITRVFALFRGQIACLLCDNKEALFGMIPSVILLCLIFRTKGFQYFMNTRESRSWSERDCGILTSWLRLLLFYFFRHVMAIDHFWEESTLA